MVQGRLQKTGVSRKMDALGRVVIPMSIRQSAKISDGDSFEFFIGEGGSYLLLRRAALSCAICGEPGILVPVKERLICQGCLKEATDALAKAE